MNLHNGDCFDILPELKNINMVLVDLPYGQTACAWDSVIDLKQMWVHLKKACTPDCVYAFFCTTKFGNTLIKQA